MRKTLFKEEAVYGVKPTGVSKRITRTSRSWDDRESTPIRDKAKLKTEIAFSMDCPHCCKGITVEIELQDN